MKTSARIISYTVQQKKLSVQLLVERPMDEIRNLQQEEKKDGSIFLSNLRLVGQIFSTRVNKGVHHVLLHVAKKKFAVERLYDLMDGPVDFTVNTATEGKLAFFLAVAAKSTGKDEPDLLYEITTFRKKGNLIKGKRNIEELSPKAQVVALDKITQLLKNNSPDAPTTEGGEAIR